MMNFGNILLPLGFVILACGVRKYYVDNAGNHSAIIRADASMAGKLRADDSNSIPASGKEVPKAPGKPKKPKKGNGSSKGHIYAPTVSETPVAKAKLAIKSRAEEFGFSLVTLTSSDDQLIRNEASAKIRNEAEICKNNAPCCICTGGLEWAYVLKDTAEGLEEGGGVVVAATIDGGIAAFTYITSYNKGEAYVEYVCRRDPNENCPPNLKAAPKAGQYTFAMSLVEAFDAKNGLESKKASLEVIDLEVADEDERNEPAEQLYQKYCFVVTKDRDEEEEEGTMMSNFDLAATVNQMPFLVRREKPCPSSATSIRSVQKRR